MELSASSLKPIQEGFFTTIPQERQKVFERYLATPIHLEALGYIYDERKMLDGNVSAGDPHTKEGLAKKSIKMPNWGEALKSFYNSAKKEQNPISAHAGIYIIKSYFGQTSGENLEKRRDMSKMLYTIQHCSGYLEYGDVLANGIATKVDTKEALRIYQEGMKACPSKSWVSQVLSAKILKLGGKL